MNAARLAVVLYLRLIEEFEIKFESVFFWSDSSTVLSYINSDSGRFHRFVANRVAFIRSHTTPDQWKHVPGKNNPADLLSRGTSDISKFIKCKLWTCGPEFHVNNITQWSTSPLVSSLGDNDADVKVFFTHVIVVRNPIEDLLNSTSSWYKLKCRFAVMIKYVFFC